MLWSVFTLLDDTIKEAQLIQCDMGTDLNRICFVPEYPQAGQ